ncbi:hypothetical protein AC249_AIPGENE23028 [Exaiptasia diaphana]|nr:hypothetical protein AC249_AIPGENE23028 [Exaiptasia diaphana]
MESFRGLQDLMLDVIFGTESHLDPTINSAEIFPDQYDIYRKGRNIHCGGVFLAIKKSIFYSIPFNSFDFDCEVFWLNLLVNGGNPMFIGVFYRPPDSNILPLENLQSSLDLITSGSNLPNIILSGDFNLPSIDWNTYSVSPNPQYGTRVNNDFLDIINSSSLSQCQLEPTRGPNVLDLVFTSNTNLFTDSSVQPGISDHDAVLFHIKSSIKVFKRLVIKSTYMTKETGMVFRIFHAVLIFFLT